MQDTRRFAEYPISASSSGLVRLCSAVPSARCRLGMAKLVHPVWIPLRTSELEPAKPPCQRMERSNKTQTPDSTDSKHPRCLKLRNPARPASPSSAPRRCFEFGSVLPAPDHAPAKTAPVKPPEPSVILRLSLGARAHNRVQLNSSQENHDLGLFTTRLNI